MTGKYSGPMDRFNATLWDNHTTDELTRMLARHEADEKRALLTRRFDAAVTARKMAESIRDELGWRNSTKEGTSDV